MAQVMLFIRYSDLFHPDDINSKESNKRFERLGGYEGLERILKTSRKVITSNNIRTVSLPISRIKPSVCANTVTTTLSSNNPKPSLR